MVSARNNETHLQSTGRELVNRFTSGIVMNPDASSSNASKMGCTHITSMYLIAHASGLVELLIALEPIPRIPLVSRVSFSR
jgi:hypothetical protein